jgi:predicted nuclease of predicted toxin-antitoxin system
VRFLIDRCAGRSLAEWLSNNGHDALEAQTIGPDPGDRALLELAESENRILVTIDKDFGELIYLHSAPHAGLIRLPDVRRSRRIEIIAEVIEQYSHELEERALITVQGRHVRVSRPPTN